MERILVKEIRKENPRITLEIIKMGNVSKFCAMVNDEGIDAFNNLLVATQVANAVNQSFKIYHNEKR